MVLPPIQTLQWDDESHVVAYFRALLARLRYPLPRVAILDGQEVPIFHGEDVLAPRPLEAQLIRKLAGGLTPAAYYSRLFVEDSTPQGTEHLVPFLKAFGIWPCAAAWFKYQGQLRSVHDFVATLSPGERVEALVHATWNGEDAFSAAVMLHCCFPERTVRVMGMDFVAPQIEDLQWVDRSHLPPWLKECTKTFFSPITQEVLALKARFTNLVELSQGDLRKSESYGTHLDIVIINGVLGQTLTRAGDIRIALDYATNALRIGGRLFIDNSGFTIAHPEFGDTLIQLLNSEFLAAKRLELVAGNPKLGQFVLEHTVI